MSDDKRTAVRWISYHSARGYAAAPGDVELMPALLARNLIELGAVEAVEVDDAAPEKRLAFKRETR